MRRSHHNNILGILLYFGGVGLPSLAQVNPRQEYLREIRQSGERREMRGYRYQETRQSRSEAGTDVIDAAGRRVRYEEYLVRPQTNQLEYRYYSRREGRTDSAQVRQTFNTDLPADLSIFNNDILGIKPTLIPDILVNELEPKGHDNPANGFGGQVPMGQEVIYSVEVETILKRGEDTYREKLFDGQVFEIRNGDPSFQGVEYNELAYNHFQLTINGVDKIAWDRSGFNATGGNFGTLVKYFPDPSGALSSDPTNRPTVVQEFPKWSDGPNINEVPLVSHVRFDFKDNTFLDWKSVWVLQNGKTGTTGDVLFGRRRDFFHDVTIMSSNFSNSDIDLLSTRHPPLYGLPAFFIDFVNYPAFP